MNTMRKQARRNPVGWVMLCIATFWPTVFAVTRVAGEQEPSSADEKVYSPDEVDVKARIKNRFDHLPARKNDCPNPVEAKVKVILHKSGKVTDVTFIKMAGCSYDREVTAAVRKLKFTPAQKDGQPVSQYSEIEYETKSVRSPGKRH